MRSISKRKKRSVLLVCALMLLLSVGSSGWLLYSGRIWFNRPSQSDYPVRGVDVSHYQGEIDWNTLASQDLSFAYIKATEGSSCVDDRFAENWAEAQDTALYVGAYHFFSFDSSGATQAENFIQTVPVTDNALPPVIDLEWYGDKADNPPSQEAMDVVLVPLIRQLTEAYGKTPILYTTKSFQERYLTETDYGCKLWIRSVFGKPETQDWTFWQYTFRGRLDGFTGKEKYIDLNVYQGTREAFLAEFSLT